MLVFSMQGWGNLVNTAVIIGGLGVVWVSVGVSSLVWVGASVQHACTAIIIGGFGAVEVSEGVG